MSRTKKGAKQPGYDYWTARPFNKIGGLTGAYAKKRTHKAERQQNKPNEDDFLPDNLTYKGE